jgi:nitrate/TMAO reductase-like tetraheme cytochrome c subunit
MPQERSVGIRDILGVAAALGLSSFLIATPAWTASPTAEKLAKPKVEKPLQGPRLAQGAKPAKSNGAETDAQAAHAALFAESRYPSAATCGSCHPQHYKEWSVSQHSYSQLSPMYMAINNFLNSVTSGTMGDFCLRCHSQVGANLGESSFISNLERHPTSREGITCVVCHRTNKVYNKVSGRIALVEGSLLQPVYGPTGNKELARVLKEGRFETKDIKKPGRKIHKKVVKFSALTSSTFCGTCHDVTLFNGFRLEEAFSEYRVSPAAGRGVSCQDCHMGKVQGVDAGYNRGPGAVVDGKPTRTRKITNHMFAGPDYSIIHPGIFPHNTEAQQMATLREWLKFDYKAGWGTDKFEDDVGDDDKFPERWESVDDRYEAREILDEQFKRLEWAREKRLELLRNGYHLGAIETLSADREGIGFRVKVKNATDGHNAPTGFTGERLVWLQVTVTDRTGAVIFRSGDLDPNGDLRDVESSYVHNGELPLDRQLFNLQSRFVVKNIRGGERERVIPIPYPISALPFVRPSILSLILTGEPTTERNHRKGIEPLGHRWAEYRIPGKALTGKAPYQANVKLMAAMIPINLVAAVQSVGFDFNMSARAVGDAVVAGHEVIWEKNVAFKIGP